MGAVMTRCVDCWIFNFMNRSVLRWLVSFDCRHDSEQSVSSAARVRRCDGGRPSAKKGVYISGARLSRAGNRGAERRGAAINQCTVAALVTRSVGASREVESSALECTCQGNQQ